MQELKVAIIFINFGPYHFARAQALSGIKGISPFFIELAGSLATHPWQVPASYRNSVRLATLSTETSSGGDYLHLAFLLNKKLNEIDPAIVATCSYRPFVMLGAACWGRARGRRVVLFLDSTPGDKRRFRPIEAAKRLIITRFYDGAFVSGQVTRQYLVQLGLSPSMIWEPYDVVDNNQFAMKAALVRETPERWRQAFDLPQHYFLYVGRYSPEKNLSRLIEAYRIYRGGCSAPWSLLLVGDGPQRSTLQVLVSSARIKGVIFRSFTQLQELPTYYALAECFVLPSISEPWGLVVNEAMACGLPVMVSRLCGCSPELVRQGENGFGFDPYDVQATANMLAMVSSLDSCTRQQMGAQSRTIISRFTPQAWAEGLSECFRTIGHGGNALSP